jgi:uncharacterized protein (UPF0335 family)
MLEIDEDEAITRLRGFISQIKELDEESKAINQRLRSVCREATESGYNASALKAIARQKFPGEVESEANDLIQYLQLIGGKDATGRFQKSGSWSQTVFGSTGWPSDEVDFDVPGV